LLVLKVPRFVCIVTLFRRFDDCFSENVFVHVFYYTLTQCVCQVVFAGEDKGNNSLLSGELIIPHHFSIRIIVVHSQRELST
jgi:hypothetical protein